MGQLAVRELINLLGHEKSQARKLAAAGLLKIGGSSVRALVPLLAQWETLETPPKSTSSGLNGQRRFSNPCRGRFRRTRNGSRSGWPPALIRWRNHCWWKTCHSAGRRAGQLQGSLHWRGIRSPLYWPGQFAAQSLAFEHQGELWATVMEANGGSLLLAQCGFKRGRFQGGLLRDSNSQRVFEHH